MIYPRDQIHDEDACLDWWQNEFAAACERMGTQVNAATLTREIVASIREIRDAFMDKPLSLIEAAEYSGYSPNHIGRLVLAGKIPNMGRLHAPKVRARDLPKKVVRLAPHATNAYDSESDARSLRVRR